MDKSPDAFRTISEVSEHIDTPAHVLRFWESRFPQIRPVKRAGGRRYYRPSDVALLMGIKQLLHSEGLTIRGVQKLLREQGVRHVASLSGLADLGETDDHAERTLEAALKANYGAKNGSGQSDNPIPTAEIVDLHEAKLSRNFDEFDQSDIFDLTDADIAQDPVAPLAMETLLDQDLSGAEDILVQADSDGVADTFGALEPQLDELTSPTEEVVAQTLSAAAQDVPETIAPPAKHQATVADLIAACALRPRHALAENAAEIAPLLRQLTALAQKMAAAPQYPQT